MHVTWPETSLKRDFSTGILLWILINFSKNLIYRTPPDDCLCWFIHSSQGFMHWSHFFLSFFPFISNNCNYGNLFSLLLFAIIYQDINVNVVKTICLGNNFPMHIRENTDFHRQKPQQLLSADANFKGWVNRI